MLLRLRGLNSGPIVPAILPSERGGCNQGSGSMGNLYIMSQVLKFHMRNNKVINVPLKPSSIREV